MINYTGINHVAMATSSLEKTICFWRDMLEMRMIIAMGHTGYKQYFFEISTTDMIAFFEWPDVENINEKDHGVPVKGPFAFDHIAFEVESDNDLWNLKAKLEAADIWVSEIIDHGFIHSLYTFDPNNIPIEFTSPVKDIDFRKNPVMKDTSPCKAAKQGAEPQKQPWLKPVFVPENERRIYSGDGKNLIS